MLWTEELFKVKKPVIGMLHLDALPGDPRYDEKYTISEITELARKDFEKNQIK